MVSTGLFVAALLAGVSAALWVSTRTAQNRLASSMGGARVTVGSVSGSTPGSENTAGSVLRVSAGTVVGLTVAGLVQHPWGVLLGLVVGVVAERVLRVSSSRKVSRRRSRRLLRDLPVTADLLSACFHAGAEPATAVAVVADAVGGPVADALHRVVSVLSLGGDPAHTWAQLGQHPELAPLGRALARAVDTGAPLADTLTVLATDLRHARRVGAQASAHRVGVYAVAPLGLCFLPAFVLLGVVPVVVGIASPVLGLVVR